VNNPGKKYRENSSFDGHLTATSRISSARFVRWLYLLPSRCRTALGFRGIDTEHWSCENRFAARPRRNQNRISVFSRPRPRL